MKITLLLLLVAATTCSAKRRRLVKVQSNATVSNLRKAALRSSDRDSDGCVCGCECSGLTAFQCNCLCECNDPAMIEKKQKEAAKVEESRRNLQAQQGASESDVAKERQAFFQRMMQSQGFSMMPCDKGDYEGECTTTHGCREIYNGANDCKNSEGGVCYCGDEPCGCSQDPVTRCQDQFKGECTTTSGCQELYGGADDCDNNKYVKIFRQKASTHNFLGLVAFVFVVARLVDAFHPLPNQPMLRHLK